MIRPLIIARREWKRLKQVPLIPLTIIGVFILLAIFSDFIAPHSPLEVSLNNRLRPPFWMEGGSLSFPLGADPLGRDMLSRIIHGARISLGIAFITLVVGAGIGTTAGLIAGYCRGKVDAVIMRLTDATLCFPLIFLALLLAVTLGPNLVNVVIAIGLVLWSRFARVIRGEVLILMERDFIAQARVAGCSSIRIVVRHLLPNVLNSVIVLFTLQVGLIIIIEASLSFLGAGIPPPTPVWGGMVAAGREYMTSAWWVTLFPGLCIMLVVLAFNLFGDWLRDKLDPRLREL